jgi:ribosomal protein S18 acetylase RimI-like enzyme
MASSERLSYRQLSSANDPSFEEFFRIYAESIHPREQKPKPLIAQMTARPDYKVFVQKEDDRVRGFSIVFAPPGEKFCLLEYMAVDAARRDSGLGGQLFLHSAQAMMSPGGEPRLMLLEVDSDREATADRQLRSRRLAFYQRLGCLRVDKLSYILPLAGDGAPPEMFLLAHAPQEIRSIQKSELRHWLQVIYETVYGSRPDDVRIARMLEGVSDPATLE